MRSTATRSSGVKPEGRAVANTAALAAVFAVKRLGRLAGRPSERPADDLRVQRAQV
jgi:hypothetical protein